MFLGFCRLIEEVKMVERSGNRVVSDMSNWWVFNDDGGGEGGYEFASGE